MALKAVSPVQYFSKQYEAVVYCSSEYDLNFLVYVLCKMGPF